MFELNQKNVRQTGSSPLSGGHSYGLNATSPVRSSSFHKLLSISKNYVDQELIPSRSPLHLADSAGYPGMDEDQLREVIDSPKEGLSIYFAHRQTRVPSIRTSPAPRSPVQNSRSSIKSSPTGQPVTTLRSPGSGLSVVSPACQTSRVWNF